MEIFKQAILAQAIDLSTLPNPTTGEDRLRTILSVVFSITGSLALLIITIAGLRYVLSHGDPNLIAQSKNAIIYALVGLVLSIFALAIVTFVIGRVS
jgi:hypothetical protein